MLARAMNKYVYPSIVISVICQVHVQCILGTVVVAAVHDSFVLATGH